MKYHVHIENQEMELLRLLFLKKRFQNLLWYSWNIAVSGIKTPKIKSIPNLLAFLAKSHVSFCHHLVCWLVNISHLKKNPSETLISHLIWTLEESCMNISIKKSSLVMFLCKNLIWSLWCTVFDWLKDLKKKNLS